jgi:hypothetical protein
MHSGIRARSMEVRVVVVGSREGFLAHPDTIPDDVTGGLLAGRFSVHDVHEAAIFCQLRS